MGVEGQVKGFLFFRGESGVEVSGIEVVGILRMLAHEFVGLLEREVSRGLTGERGRTHAMVLRTLPPLPPRDVPLARQQPLASPEECRPQLHSFLVRRTLAS